MKALLIILILNFDMELLEERRIEMAKMASCERIAHDINMRNKVGIYSHFDQVRIAKCVEVTNV